MNLYFFLIRCQQLFVFLLNHTTTESILYLAWKFTDLPEFFRFRTQKTRVSKECARICRVPCTAQRNPEQVCQRTEGVIILARSCKWCYERRMDTFAKWHWWKGFIIKDFIFHFPASNFSWQSKAQPHLPWIQWTLRSILWYWKWRL